LKTNFWITSSQTRLTPRGGGYARQSVSFGTASAGTISNSADVSFTATGANFGDVLAVGFYDAATVGNLLAYTTITTATVNDGDTLTFATGDIDISLD